MTDDCGWRDSFIKYTATTMEVADEWFKTFPDETSQNAALFYIVDPSANPLTVSQLISKYIEATTPIPSFEQQLDYYKNSVNERKKSELNKKLFYSGGIGFVLGVVTLSVIQLGRK
jgi:hypothetical protein